MSGPNVNPEIHQLQPHNAAVGEFDESDPDAIAEAVVSQGVDPDRLVILVGDRGLEQFQARASRFRRLFDDSDNYIGHLLKQGGAAVGVSCVDERDAASVQQSLLDAGASNVHYFGRWTND